MDFCSGVFDFRGISMLSGSLYERCCKASGLRNAPKELNSLLQEIKLLHRSIEFLDRGAYKEDSTPTRALEDDMGIVEGAMVPVCVTLKMLEKHLKRWKCLDEDHYSPRFRLLFPDVRWSGDLEEIRNELASHNEVFREIITWISYPQPREVVEQGVNDIKYMIGDIEDWPLTQSGVGGGEVLTVSLSQDLMKAAGINGRKWSAIGVDEWIQVGSWWLLKSQSDLFTERPLGRRISSQAYANLIKAVGIMIDVIYRHPQLDDYVATNTGYGARLLVETIRRELDRVAQSGLAKPTLTQLGTCNLEIWETEMNRPTLPPHSETSSSGLSRQASEGEYEYVLFQRFGYYQREIYDIEVPCIVLLLMHKTIKEIKIVLRDQSWLTIATFLVKDKAPYPVGNVMQIGDHKIRFSTARDVHYLCAISEAAKECLFYPKFENDLEKILDGLTLLFCIKNNYREAVERLLEDKGIYRETIKARGLAMRMYSTRLRWAAKNVALQFLKRPVPMNICPPNTKGYLSLFFWCIKEEYNKMAIILCEGRGVRVDEESLALCTSVHDALSTGDIALVEFVSSENGVNIDATTPWGNKALTALQLSAMGGFVEAVDHLIGVGADVNAMDSEALRQAAYRGHLDVVNRLLDAGADAKARYSEALRKAADKGHLEVVDRLLGAGADAGALCWQAFRHAAWEGHLDVVNRLLEAGADINARDSEALRRAAWEGHLNVVNRLLEAGADPARLSSKDRDTLEAWKRENIPGSGASAVSPGAAVPAS